ncbi:MAG: AAA family ATPase [Sulfuricaulis sp.]
MYNANLRNVSVDVSALDPGDPLRLANQEKAAGARNFGVAIADLGELGLGSGFKGTESVAYLGTEDHPHLARCNPRFVFDNIELDRLLTATINREWEREDHEPRRGVLLMGPTGAGKTTYLRERFARQGIPVVEMTWRPEMDAVDAVYTREMIGGDIVLAPAAIQIAARGGYPVIINEIDCARPGQLLGLNEIIDSGTITIPETGEVIQARRGFAVFATCNSAFTEDRSGAYAGTRTQNASVLNRFFKFQFDYPSMECEKGFIMNHFPALPESTAEQYAQFVSFLRKASDPIGTGLTVGNASKRLSREFSRRNLLDWLGLTQSFAHLEAKQISVPKYALKPIYTAGMPDDEVATVEHLFDVAFNIVPSDITP